MSVRPFSPTREDPSTLSERTVGRTELLQSLHNALLTGVTTASKPHMLLVGPRGAGKSHLVEVALYRATEDPGFDRAIVVRIPEDSNDITRFADLQRRILQVLTPGAPMPKPEARATAIDEALGDRVVVLVIENLDRVFSDIGIEGQRNLRAWVETSRQVLLLATTPLIFPAVSQRDQPWFGGLAAYVLPDLTPEDGQDLVALLAAARGDEELAAFVRSETGAARIRAVAAFTGGSPRIWMILGQLATKESLDELVPAVEDLLEGLVPYYQQLLWSLSPTERQLVTRLSQTGMMTVGDLAAATDVEPGTATNTLRRLEQRRWVVKEKPRTSDQRLSYYRVREPLLRYHLQYRDEAGEPLGLVVELLKGLFPARERASGFLGSADGSLGQVYFGASLGPVASGNSLLMEPVSEYPLIALDWSRSSDPELHQAGRALCGAWRGVGVVGTRENLAPGVEGAMTRQYSPGVKVLLRLVSSCLTPASTRELALLLRDAWDTGSATAISVVAENLAAVHGQAREFEEALATLDGAAARLAQDNGVDSEAVLRLRGESAFWTGEAGKPRQVLNLYTQLLTDMLRVLGPDHPDTLTTRHQIAYWTGQTGNSRQALTLYTQLLTDRLRVLGPDHPDTLTTRHGIACYTGETGDPQQALTLYTDLLTDRLRVLGPDHPATLTTLGQIAYWTGQTGNNPRQALTLYTDLLTDMVRVLGPDHPATLTTLGQIAYWTGQTGNPRQALTLYTQLLTDMVRVLGPDHPDTLTTRGNIAYWTGQTGNPRHALTLYTQLLTDRRRVLGPDHPDALITVRNATFWVSSWAELLPLITAFGESIPDEAMAALAGAAWRVSKDSPTTTPLSGAHDLIARIARAAQGDDTARASLPPELLAALESQA